MWKTILLQHIDNAADNEGQEFFNRKRDLFFFMI
jgi:hypothetical protein